MALVWSEAFLTEDHKMIAQAAREFAQSEIAPKAAAIDKEHRYPAEIIKGLGELGFMGMMVPEQWGGAGMDCLSYTAALEEISVACASTAVVMSVNNSLVCQVLADNGTDEQKEKFLKPLASGAKLGCYCLSETTSGSDAATMAMKATKDGDGWVLNGSKNWITNGEQADVAIVFAVIDPAKNHKGIGCFLVEKGAEGFSVGKAEDKLGIRGSTTNQLNFDNVSIPASQLLGGEEEGFTLAMKILDGGRIGIACQALGIARASLENAIDYSKERMAFGKELFKLGGIQNHLSNMAMKVDAGRMLIRQAAWQRDQGKNYSRYASEAKLFCSEMAQWVTNKGVQVLGGYGYTTEYPQERFMRDAKITEIYEGTSEIQRIVISKNLIKENS